jgi:hypothetical protein
MDDHSHGARGGYRRASDETWALARRDYEAGHTGEEVCARYDLRPGTLRARASVEGWRRIDAPDPEPVDLYSGEALDLPDYEEMALVALIRVNRALQAGRAAEAGSWMRLHEKLTALAALPDPDPEPAPPPPPPPRPEDAPDWNLKARHAAIHARFAEWDAARAARESSNSDNSDTVFSAPSPLVGEGCAQQTASGAQGEGDSGSERQQAGTLTHTPHPSRSAAHPSSIASGALLHPQGETGITSTTPVTPPRSPPPAAP